ncbi:hypothetical protein [Nostocoides jenkinsii]|uniref:Uncharacterized protein n=1 Tax=Nostocoides jenkinsii Ben 74 TaxID=1193518 RepID=A0A077MGD1_9MICO|nr:hypothetical protein [Tetrasphaera jenkinsii]CCI54693.1 hypothetical protein BN13_80062 [Tetrasphaera jenkinsii Ben 74]
MTTPPSFNLAGLDAALTWIRRDSSQRRSDRDAATIGSWESGIDPDLYTDFPGPVGDLLRDKSLAEASLGFVDPLVTMRLLRPYFLACGVRPRSRTAPPAVRV